MFIGNSSKDANLALNPQETVNWYIETQPQGARTQQALIGAPGTSLFASFPAGSAIYGMLNHNEQLYVVSGNRLYLVSLSGAIHELGVMEETGPVSMDGNLTQVVIVNGVSGYVYDEATEVFTKISSPNFYASTSVCYQDGYLIFNRAGTGQFFVSDIDDALTYNAINFDEAVLRGDTLLSVVSDTRNVWLFGQRTIECWYNGNQNAGSPFVPNRGAAQLRGTAAARSVVPTQIGIFFLGDDHNVYWLQGYTPKNISADAQAKELTGYLDLSDAFAFVMNVDGHWFYVLTLPTQKRTFVYDPEENAWHNRESYGLGYWRASCFAEVGGRYLVGDKTAARIGVLSRSTYDEYGQPWVSRRTTGVDSAKNRLVGAQRLELVFASGQVPQNVDHVCRLEYSDNKGMTYGNPLINSIGKAGDGNKRTVFWGLGSFRNRVWRLSVSTPGNRDLIEEQFDYEVGGY